MNSDILGLLIKLVPETFLRVSWYHYNMVMSELTNISKNNTFDEIVKFDNSFIIRMTRQLYTIQLSDHMEQDVDYPIVRSDTINQISEDSLIQLHKLRYLIAIETLEDDSSYDESDSIDVIDEHPYYETEIVSLPDILYTTAVLHKYIKLMLHLIHIHNDMLRRVIEEGHIWPELALVMGEKFAERLMKEDLPILSIGMFEYLKSKNYDLCKNNNILRYAVETNNETLLRTLLQWKTKKGGQVKISKSLHPSPQLIRIFREERKGINFKNYFK